MVLVKLFIVPRSPSRLLPRWPIFAMFNPESYSISKSVSWNSTNNQMGSGNQPQRQLNAPILTFGGGGSRELSLELFFDITSGLFSDLPIMDVRFFTNKIVALSRIERDRGRPPVCDLYWGLAPTGSDFPFTGVIGSLSQQFTLFNQLGNPLRATLNVTFLEFLDPEEDQRLTDPELTTHTVKQGDSLSHIAAQLYLDPSRWREIAEANNLDDPRQLEVGQVLTIPKIP